MFSVERCGVKRLTRKATSRNSDLTEFELRLDDNSCGEMKFSPRAEIDVPFTFELSLPWILRIIMAPSILARKVYK
jgi:hypothetical protein